MRRISWLSLALLGLLSAPAARAAEAPGRGFRLVVRWYRTELKRGGILARISGPGELDVAALKKAATEAFAPVFGEGAGRDGTPFLQQTRCWQVVELLADPAFRAEAYRVAALSPAPKGYLDLVPDDEFLESPVRPATATRVVRGVRLRQVRFGELGSTQTPRLAETLLHELAHVGQDFATSRFDYGHDGRHRVDEVLPWRSAFHEGWADYQAAHLPPAHRQAGELGARVRAPEDVAPLVFDLPDGAGEREIPAEEASAAQLFGTELVVARALWKLEQSQGREAVEAAFRATNGDDERTLATLVGALARARPKQTAALREALAAASRGRAGKAFLDSLLAGRLPVGVTARRRPLELPAPAPRAAAPDPVPGGGLLGQGD